MKNFVIAAHVAASQCYARYSGKSNLRRFSYVLALVLISAIGSLTSCEDYNDIQPNNLDEGTGLCCGCKLVSGIVVCPNNASAEETK
jgi:hypothetical protein